MNKIHKNGVICCIHGNSSSSRIFNSLKESKYLKQAVIAFDLPGHGKNNNVLDENKFTFSSYREFLIEQLSTINDNILLFGNSLGGHLAIEIAHEIKNLKGLVIMGTPPVKQPLNFQEAWIANEELNTFLTEHPADELIEKAASVTVFDQTLSMMVADDFRNTVPAVRKVCASEIMSGKMGNEYKLFTELDKPKFIIAGSEDPSVNKDYLRECQAHSINECKIFNVEQCGHYPIDASDTIGKIISEIANKVLI